MADFLATISNLQPELNKSDIDYLTKNIQENKTYINNIRLDNGRVFFGDHGYTNNFQLIHPIVRIEKKPQYSRKNLRILNNQGVRIKLSPQASKHYYLAKAIHYAQQKYANSENNILIAQDWIIECLQNRASTSSQVPAIQRLAQNKHNNTAIQLCKSPIFPRGFLKALTIGYIFERGNNAFIQNTSQKVFDITNFIREIHNLSPKLSKEDINLLIQQIEKHKSYLNDIYLDDNNMVHFGKKGYTNVLPLNPPLPLTNSAEIASPINRQTLNVAEAVKIQIKKQEILINNLQTKIDNLADEFVNKPIEFVASLNTLIFPEIYNNSIINIKKSATEYNLEDVEPHSVDSAEKYTTPQLRHKALDLIKLCYSKLTTLKINYLHELLLLAKQDNIIWNSFTQLLLKNPLLLALTFAEIPKLAKIFINQQSVIDQSLDTQNILINETDAKQMPDKFQWSKLLLEQAEILRKTLDTNLSSNELAIRLLKQTQQMNQSPEILQKILFTNPEFLQLVLTRNPHAQDHIQNQFSDDKNSELTSKTTEAFQNLQLLQINLVTNLRDFCEPLSKEASQLYKEL